MTATSPLVSVIVPALDEESTISELLAHLDGLLGRWEVIVVDGGSRDRTAALAASHSSQPHLTSAPRGRARQLNAGAAVATGEALLFLHADTHLPAQAYAALVAALSDPRVVGGNFSLRFDGRDRFSRMLGAWYAVQRRLGVYYGDSAIWLRRSAFNELEGFRPLAIMEDYDLVRRLERLGRTACLPGPAVTSARRWRTLGLPRTIGAWVLIRWLYLAGLSPARLARLYPTAR